MYPLGCILGRQFQALGEAVQGVSSDSGRNIRAAAVDEVAHQEAMRKVDGQIGAKRFVRLLLVQP